MENLSLVHLVRPGTTARAVSIKLNTDGREADTQRSLVRFVTSDGFQFEISLAQMGGALLFPLEGKAIEFLKWIRPAVKAALEAKLEAELNAQQTEALDVVNPVVGL